MLLRSLCFWAALLVLSSDAEALEGCFCAKDNRAVQKCGEVLRFDPSDAVTLKEYVPLDCKRRTAPPVTLSFLNYTECPHPPVLRNCPKTPGGENVVDDDDRGERGAEDRVGGGPEGGPQVRDRNGGSKPPPVSESFGVMGSNTIGEVLMPALIAGFGKARGYTVEGDRCNSSIPLRRQGSSTSAITVRCESRGTHTGIPALAGRDADIAMLSRPITPAEQEMMRRQGFPKMTSVPFESVIALDGLRIIVSPQNRVNALSLDQIAQVFAGEITNWSQLGGRPGRINLYARDTNSGTRDTFETLVMEARGKPIAAIAQSFESSTALADSVRGDPYGIGFVGFAYTGDTKALAISSSCGIEHEPSGLSIKAEDYPLSRRLYLYKARPQSVFAQDLIDYALSDPAQPVIASAGYVNQAIDSWNETESRNRVLEYAAAPTREPGLDIERGHIEDLTREVNGAKRLSINFRFAFASEKLDTKALDDALRLARYLRERYGRGVRLLLLGFADAVGSFNANLALAEKRAMSVRDALLSTGGNLDSAAIIAKGYGELMPVACNGSDVGREKNRRVEVYLLDR